MRLFLKPIAAGSGVFALIVALTACTDAGRQNAFVKPIFGGGPDSVDDRAAGTQPGPGAGAGLPPDGRIDATALNQTRRGLDRTSPIIRRPGEVDRGTGIRLRPPISIGADGTVTMNFERIGISDFARAVFGEILGLDYTVNPGVSGVISLQVSRPVPRTAVYPIVERALASVGVLVRRDGDLLFIEPDPRGPSSGGMATAVVVRRLQHVDSAQMEQALQPFLAPDARLSAGPLPDTLILSGSDDGVNALSDLVDALDSDPLSNRSFALFPLRVSPAFQVAEELRQILGTNGSSGPQILEIERMNAVLIVTDSPRAIEEAQFWVGKLDRGEAGGAQVHIYQVQNRRARDLAELLNKSVVGASVSAPTYIAAALAPGLTEEIAGIDAVAEGAPAPELTRPFAATQVGSPSSDVSILADEGTNSIMTIATPERYAIIELALRQLDVQPVQVLIEATVVEVTLNDTLRYGVRWFFESGDVSGGFSDISGASVDTVFPGFNFVLDTRNVRAVVSALDSVTDVEIVSSPSLMVLNNEAARLQVGDQVPIATSTSSFNSVDASGIPVTRNEIQYRDTGVILQITPRVNASGVVMLDIVQDVSEVSQTSSSGIDSPTISQRRFESSVLLRDRETIALGGLIRSSRSSGKNGIPILSDIPLLGALFGEKRQSSVRTELLVIIRPIVIRNHNEARAAYQELRSKLSGLARLEPYLPAN